MKIEQFMINDYLKSMNTEVNIESYSPSDCHVLKVVEQIYVNF